MEEFPGNSHKSKEETSPTSPRPVGKKVEQVTSGSVTRRKRPLSKRFSEVFVGGDARSAGSYIVLDVLLPAFKDMVADAGSQWIERLLFGESRSPRSRSSVPTSGSNGYVSYNRYAAPSGGRREEPRQQISRKARATHDFDEIILEGRGEAEEVIDRLFDLISRYETATVADLYELVGVQGNFTDEKWGWSDIRGAGVTRVRNGYLLDLPKPDHLD